MNERIKLVVIKEALDNTIMPFCLDMKTNLVFQHQLEKSFLQIGNISSRLLQILPEISPFSEDDWTSKGIGGMMMSVFYGWIKVAKNKDVFFVHKQTVLDYPHLSKNDKAIFVAYSDNEMWFKRDECLVNVPAPWIEEYFKWANNEIIHLGGIGEFYHQYSSLIELSKSSARDLSSYDEKLTEEITEIEYETLPANYQEELSKLKQRIVQDITIQIEGGFDTQFEDVKEEFVQKIDFLWNSQEVSITFPAYIQEQLSNGSLSLEYVAQGQSLLWLEEQKPEFQETLMAMWASFVADNLYRRDPIDLNWSDFRSYLLDWLRKDCSVNLQKILFKVKASAEKFCHGDRVQDFSYITEVSDFIKLALYVEKQASIHENTECIIDVETISNQYFYTLNQDHVLLEMWGAIVYEKLNKKAIHQTFAKQFEELAEKFPNFKEVVTYYSGAMHIFEQTGTPPSPALLLGSPGLGKTHFANALAKIVGSQMLVLQVSSLTAGWIISGSAAQWKDATMGKVASSLLNGPTMSPVLLLDEIDKKSEGNYDPLGALYPLLENETAKSFMDEYLEFPLNASKVIWMATANQMYSIDEPILDRFTIFEIPKLSETETIKIIHNIYNDLTRGLRTQELSKVIINALKDKSPRQIKQVLKKALANAAAARESDITLKQEHLDLKSNIKKIGF